MIKLHITIQQYFISPHQTYFCYLITYDKTDQFWNNNNKKKINLLSGKKIRTTVCNDKNDKIKNSSKRNEVNRFDVYEFHDDDEF